MIHPSIQKVEERIADALISRAEEASRLRVRVIALEAVLRQVREIMSSDSIEYDDIRDLHAIIDNALPQVDAQKIVDGFMDFHGRKTTKTNPDCPAFESGHGVLGSGCICGSQASDK